MADSIKDGTGGCFEAQVDSEHKLSTRAVQKNELSHSLSKGKTWNIGTGFLTLTDAAQTPLLYIKNTGTNDLEIDLYVLLTKASTGGDGSDGIVEIFRNPNAGTIVTDAVVAYASNMNFGSANEIPANVYSGGTGKTVSGYDANQTLRSKVGAENRLLLGIITLLPKGASVCVAYTPPTGNTSIEVEAVVEIFEEDQ